MSDQQNKSGRRFRFRLRTMILAVALVAIALVGGRYAYDWYTSTSLADAVLAFNSTASSHRVGEHEPPITEDEIISAIESQLPTLDATDRVKAIYSRIARSRRLPRGAELDSISGSVRSSGERYTVWWINLNVTTEERFSVSWANLHVMSETKSGYGLRIRETDNPAVVDDSMPLQR